MTDLVFVVIGKGLDTNLKPAFFLNRSRHAASNRSLETFSGSPKRAGILFRRYASRMVEYADAYSLMMASFTSDHMPISSYSTAATEL
jgi:hypothetical protein